MSRMNRIAIAILTVCCAAAGVANGQSLADTARQERERRKNATETKVITNDALPPSKVKPAEPPPAADPSAKPATAKGGAEAQPAAKPPEESKRGEAWWREAFAEARTNLSRAEAEVQTLELQASQAHKDFLIRDDLFNKEGQMNAVISALNTDLEAARRRAADSRQKIADLEEELRRAGGQPGWAR